MAPPRAQGEYTSSWLASRSARLAATSTSGCAASTRAIAAGFVSKMTTLAPSATQVIREPVPDLADSLDADGPPGQAGVAPEVIGGRAHALEHAECGED